MLTHPTHERLITLGLTGMAKALEEQRRSPDLDALSFEERVELLVDREAAERDTKRLTTRLKFAALRQSACVEDVDLRTPRGIDRAVFAKLVAGDWIDRNENLLVTGATSPIHTAHLSISLDLQFFLLRITRRRTPELAGLRCLLDFVTVEVVRENDPGRAFAELASRQRAVLDEAADRGRTDV